MVVTTHEKTPPMDDASIAEFVQFLEDSIQLGVHLAVMAGWLAGGRPKAVRVHF